MNSRVALITMLLALAQGAAMNPTATAETVSKDDKNSSQHRDREAADVPAVEEVHVQNPHRLAAVVGVADIRNHVFEYIGNSYPIRVDRTTRDSYQITAYAHKLLESFQKGYTVEQFLAIDRQRLGTLIISFKRFDAEAFNAINPAVWQMFGSVLVDVDTSEGDLRALLKFLNENKLEFDIKLDYFSFEYLEELGQLMEKAKSFKSFWLSCFFFEKWVPFASKTKRVELNSWNLEYFVVNRAALDKLFALKREHNFLLVLSITEIVGDSPFVNVETFCQLEDIKNFNEVNAKSVVFDSDVVPEYVPNRHMMDYLTSAHTVIIEGHIGAKGVQYIQEHAQKWERTVQAVEIRLRFPVAPVQIPKNLSHVKSLEFRSECFEDSACSLDLTGVLPGLINLSTLSLQPILSIGEWRDRVIERPVQLILPSMVSIPKIVRYYLHDYVISNDVTFTAPHLVLDGIEFSDKIHFEGNESIEIGTLNEAQVGLLVERLPPTLKTLTVRDEHLAGLIRQNMSLGKTFIVVVKH